MATYGLTLYGSDVYGYDFPPDYRVDPFTADATNYNEITLSWTAPAGDILAYRLIKNRYGYPVDQDDGEILIDSLSYPGSSFVDTDVISGEYHYYGFYVLLNFTGNFWVRSGWTACLAVKDYGYHLDFLHPNIPGVFTSQTGFADAFIVETPPSMPGQQGIVPTDNVDFHQYLSVISWGMNYLKTQYDTYLHVNDPWQVPLTNLYNLADEVGININPDISPYTLRKAIAFNAVINEQRGTVPGIVAEVSALTGWNIDLQVGQNFMLEVDQSEFLDPIDFAWNSSLSYAIGEKVTFGNFFYVCQATGNFGNPPTGTSSSNTWWVAILSQSSTTLYNSVTGFVNTWEPLYPSVTNGVTTGTSIAEMHGVSNPLTPTSFAWNALQVVNNGGSSQNVWLRSIARTPSDISTVTTTFAPDKYQVINDGIPVPYTLASQVWEPNTWYFTNNIVTYNSQPFIALRASYNAIPPYGTIGSDSTEWAPISWGSRYRICTSAYCTGSTAVPVYPFVEWYDDQGNYITRIVARNQTPGSVVFPNSFAFDSFTNGANTSISGRLTDDGSGTWIQEAGTFKLSQYNNGSVYPSVTGQRTYALISSGVANTQVGVTLLTAPEAGQSEGLVLRWTDDTHYIRASATDIRTNNGGTWTTLGTYSTACSPGDRLVVTMNGTTITAFRNGSSVLSVTSSFNQTATSHGMIVENT